MCVWVRVCVCVNLLNTCLHEMITLQKYISRKTKLGQPSENISQWQYKRRKKTFCDLNKSYFVF